MGFDWKDIVLVIAGGLLGVPASMTATLVLGPAMTIMCGFHAVKKLAKLRQCVRSDEVFDGPWQQDWHVSSKHFAPENLSSMRVYRFLHLLAAEAEQTTATGASYGFRMLAVIDGSIITGKWMDPRPNGYYGTFQLILAHTHSDASGQWMGFSSAGIVKTGTWTWRKDPSGRA